MPTIFRTGPYRFFFYAGDRDEPKHVHIERDDKVAKFWLEPIRLQHTGGLKRTDIKRVYSIIETHYPELVEAWNDYFGN